LFFLVESFCVLSKIFEVEQLKIHFANVRTSKKKSVKWNKTNTNKPFASNKLLTDINVFATEHQAIITDYKYKLTSISYRTANFDIDI